MTEAADIDVMLEDFGVTITHGSDSALCLLDTPDVLALDMGETGGVMGARIVATMRTGSLPDVTVGSLVVIDGVNHYVRQKPRSGDGYLQHLLCSRNAPATGPDAETPTSWVGNDVPFLVTDEVDGLPNASVLADSPSVQVDRSTPGQLRLVVAGSAAGGMVTYPVEDPGGLEGFNSERTTFVGLYPVEPDLTGSNSAFLTMSGKGLLRLTTDPPAPYQFRLSGPTNQDIEFGYAPDPGDFGNATCKPA